MKKVKSRIILIVLTLIIGTQFLAPIVINAAPVIPIGTSVQANPFESNPTGGINNTLVGAVGTEAAARDGNFDTGITWQIGGTTNSFLNMTPFENMPPGGQFTPIGWVDIKIRYRASATVDDNYRFMYQVGARQALLQAYVSGAAAKFDNDGNPDERTFSKVAEPRYLSPGGWNWTGIANFMFRIDTQQVGGSEDNPANTITVYEVWLSIYSGAYPYSPTIPLTARPSYVKYWDQNGGGTWTADEPAINDTNENNAYNSGVDTILTFNMNASQLPNVPNDGATIKLPAANIRFYDKNGDGKWTGGGLEGEPAIYDLYNPGVWDIGSERYGRNDDVRVGTQPPAAVAIEPPVIQGLHAGDKFFIDVYVINAFKMHGFQFVIRYDTYFLTALPGFFAYNPFISAAPSGINDAEGWVSVSFSSWFGDPAGFTGSGPVVRIYFQVDNDGTSLLHIDTSPTSPTAVSNVFGKPIPVSYWRDGIYTLMTHNVAVTDVAVNATQAMPGITFKVDATVANWGAQNETFTVKAYYNSTPPTQIGSPQTVADLIPGSSETRTFNWTTSGVPVGHYSITVEATLALDENPGDDTRSVAVIVGKHDVAVTDVLRAYPSLSDRIPPSDTLKVERGKVVHINATVQNLGTFSETFSLNFSYTGGGSEAPRIMPDSQYVLKTFAGISLGPGDSQLFTYDWNTTTVQFKLQYGRPENFSLCSLRGSATEVPFEKGVDYDNTVDNVFKTDNLVNVTRSRAPQAKFDVATLVQQRVIGKPIDFSAGATFTPQGTKVVSLQWNFGDSSQVIYVEGVNLTEGYSPSHPYANTGLFSVKLTVGNNESLFDSVTHNLTIAVFDLAVTKVVRAYPTQDVAVSADVTLKVTKGEFVYINVTIASPSTVDSVEPVNVTVYYDETVIGKVANEPVQNGTSKTLLFSWNTTGVTPGTYIVKAKLKPVSTFASLWQSNLTNDELTSGSVAVLAFPVASFTHSPSKPYVGQTVIFNASASYDSNPSGTIDKYVWVFGDGTTRAFVRDVNLTQTATHVFAARGKYTVRLNVTNNNGLTGTVTQSVNVYVHDVAVTDVSASVGEVVAGESVVVSVAVENQGNFTETFEVTLEYDDAEIDTVTVTDLGPGASTTLTFTWDTSGVAAGNYTLSGIASLPVDNDLSDNTRLSTGQVIVNAGSNWLLYIVVGAVVAIVVVGVLVYLLKFRKPKSS